MSAHSRRDRHDVAPNGFIAGEDILAGAVLGTDPKTGHLVMVGRIEPRPSVETIAQDLFEWNTPSDPYFVVQGRDVETQPIDEDPYVPIVRAVLGSVAGALTSEPALAAFREAWEQADAEGATGDRVRRGMAAAIEAVTR